MRSHFLSYIRIFSILFVVVWHSYCPYGAWAWIKVDSNSVFHIIVNIMDPFVAMMPLLTFVSGFLFYMTRNKYPNYGVLLLKKFERLIVPMLVFGVLYFFVFEREVKINISTVNIIFSGYSILWYCNMLFLCFVIAYPISKNVKNIYLQIFVLLVSFAAIYIKMPPIMGLDMLLRLFFYFYFGVIISVYISRCKIFDSKLFVISLGVLFLLSYIVYEHNVFFDINNKLIKVISGNLLRISFILFIVLGLRIIESKLNYSKIVKLLDENSFGCYIFHFPILYFFYKTELLKLNALQVNWYFPVLNCIIATVLSYGFTFYFRRTKTGKILLG